MNSDPPRNHLYVIDDDPAIVKSMEAIANRVNAVFHGFLSISEIEDLPAFRRPDCLILDHALANGQTGLSLIDSVGREECPIATLVISGRADVQLTVQYMRAGVLSVIEKPIAFDTLIDSIQEAFKVDQDRWKEFEYYNGLYQKYLQLSERRSQVLKSVLTGRVNKSIAREVGVSDRTIELDRASLLKEFGAENFVALSAMIASMHRYRSSMGLSGADLDSPVPDDTPSRQD